MTLDWMEGYRDIIGNFYRSANGYSQICKMEIFGVKVKFSPYEVQIMEHILEHADQYRNMKWYAQKMGLSQATYSKYVQKLVDKGLLEKYHAENNHKDIILRVSPIGMEEYEKYASFARENLFENLFKLLGQFDPQQLEIARKVFEVWGAMHAERREKDNPALIRIE